MENEIIEQAAVYRTSKGTPVTNSLLVAETFGKPHKNVLKAISSLSSATNLANADFCKWFYKTSYTDALGRRQPLVVMTRDGFTLLAMGFTGEKAIRFKVAFIERFNEMEAEIKRLAAREAQAYDLPRNLPEALRRLADQVEITEQQKALLAQKDTLIEAQRPRVEFSKAVEGSSDSILVREMARVVTQAGIPTGERRLFEWLRSNGWLCQRGESYNLPTQRAQEMGLLEVKVQVVGKPDGTTIRKRTPKVTGKGQVYFLDKLRTEYQAERKSLLLRPETARQATLGGRGGQVIASKRKTR